ncbi:hypothetical protein Trydic_g12181 [Trypoxylus dichotomus]
MAIRKKREEEEGVEETDKARNDENTREKNEIEAAMLVARGRSTPNDTYVEHDLRVMSEKIMHIWPFVV